jgi:hypothetical protein
MAHKVVATAREIDFAAQEIVWTVRGLVGNAATIFATAGEIVSAAAQVVLAIGEVPAPVATTSPADAGGFLAVHWPVLRAETIVLPAATTPPNPAKTLKKKGNPLKIVKCCVWVINNSSPPVPKVDRLF